MQNLGDSAKILEVDAEMMKISIAEAKGSLGQEIPFAFQTTAEELGAAEEDFSFEGEISVRGSLVYTGVCYRVSGKIKAVKAFACDRCLKECQEEQNLSFEEDFHKAGETDDQETLVVDGDAIEITDLVRDTILAAQSLSNLCRPDCKGLCQVCGADLNEGDCGCDRFVPDPRLAALQQLLNKDE